MPHRDERDLGFFQWSIVGFMLAFGAVAILSIGGPFFLLGVLSLGFMLGRGTRWPAALGTLGGAGIVGIMIGAIGAVAAPGIWAASGLSLIALSVAAFWWIRCRPIR